MPDILIGAGLVMLGMLVGCSVSWLFLWLGNKSQGIMPAPPLAQSKKADKVAAQAAQQANEEDEAERKRLFPQMFQQRP